jgi:hypothetical protein
MGPNIRQQGSKKQSITGQHGNETQYKQQGGNAAKY